jgi:hypothetical protein
MCSPLLVLIHQAADDTGELHIIIDCAYLRPKATGRMEFSARLLDNSTSA